MLEELEEKLGGLASRQDKRLSALEMRMNAGELSVMEIKTEFKNLKDFIRESQKKSLQITIAAIMGGFAIAGAVIGVIFK